MIAMHVCSPYYASLDVSEGAWWLSNVIISVSKSMGSALFVMLSGFILMQKPLDYQTFYQNRVKRLIVPLIFWSFFYTVFSFLFFDHSLKDFVWRISAGLLLSGRSYFHLWYLSMFFCLMMIAPIINKWVFGVRPSVGDFKVVGVLAFVFFGLSSLAHLKKSFGFDEIVWFKEFGIYVFYFILGHQIGTYICECKVSVPTLVAGYLSLIVAAILLNYILVVNGIRNDNVVVGNDALLGFVGTCLVFSLVALLKPGKKNQTHLGRYAENGFGIYLVHPFILFFIFKLMSALTDNKVVTVFSAIVLTAAGSYLLIRTLRTTAFGRLIT